MSLSTEILYKNGKIITEKYYLKDIYILVERDKGFTVYENGVITESLKLKKGTEYKYTSAEEGELSWGANEYEIKNSAEIRNDIASEIILNYPNGKLEKTYTFKDGDCNGLSAVYKLDGSKLIEKNICKKEETILNVWNKEGEQVVKDGNGKFIDYDELGKKVVEGNITNGKKDGIWSYYRLDGSMQSLSNYQNGILLSSKFYENNGEIEQEQIYKNNKLKLTKYYEKGKVVEERSED